MFKETYDFVSGCVCSHPGPHEACGPQVGRPDTEWTELSSPQWTFKAPQQDPGRAPSAVEKEGSSQVMLLRV